MSPVYNVLDSRYQVPLYLWQIKPVLKLSKVAKHVQDYRNYFPQESNLLLVVVIDDFNAQCNS